MMSRSPFDDPPSSPSTSSAVRRRGLALENPFLDPADEPRPRSNTAVPRPQHEGSGAGLPSPHRTGAHSDETRLPLSCLGHRPASGARAELWELQQRRMLASKGALSRVSPPMSPTRQGAGGVGGPGGRRGCRGASATPSETSALPTASDTRRKGAVGGPPTLSTSAAHLLHTGAPRCASPPRLGRCGPTTTTPVSHSGVTAPLSGPSPMTTTTTARAPPNSTLTTPPSMADKYEPERASPRPSVAWSYEEGAQQYPHTANIVMGVWLPLGLFTLSPRSSSTHRKEAKGGRRRPASPLQRGEAEGAVSPERAGNRTPNEEPHRDVEREDVLAPYKSWRSRHHHKEDLEGHSDGRLFSPPLSARGPPHSSTAVSRSALSRSLNSTTNMQRHECSRVSTHSVSPTVVSGSRVEEDALRRRQRQEQQARVQRREARAAAETKLARHMTEWLHEYVFPSSSTPSASGSPKSAVPGWMVAEVTTRHRFLDALWVLVYHTVVYCAALRSRTEADALAVEEGSGATPGAWEPVRLHYSKGFRRGTVASSAVQDGVRSADDPYEQGDDVSSEEDLSSDTDGQPHRSPSPQCHLSLTPLTALEWRHLRQTLAGTLRYPRAEVYTQTLTHSSPTELVLVLLWCTQQYGLIALAEHVVISSTYPFLLATHTSHAVLEDNSRSRGCIHTRDLPDPDEQVEEDPTAGAMLLLQHFPKAAAWPPLEFNEKAVWTYRLDQLQRVGGFSFFPDEGNGPISMLSGETTPFRTPQGTTASAEPLHKNNNSSADSEGASSAVSHLPTPAEHNTPALQDVLRFSARENGQEEKCPSLVATCRGGPLQAGAAAPLSSRGSSSPLSNSVHVEVVQENVPPSAELTGFKTSTRFSSMTMLTRRVLGLRRLLDKALNRVEFALLERATWLHHLCAQSFCRPSHTKHWKRTEDQMVPGGSFPQEERLRHATSPANAPPRATGLSSSLTPTQPLHLLLCAKKAQASSGEGRAGKRTSTSGRPPTSDTTAEAYDLLLEGLQHIERLPQRVALRCKDLRALGSVVRRWVDVSAAERCSPARGHTPSRQRTEEQEVSCAAFLQESPCFTRWAMPPLRCCPVVEAGGAGRRSSRCSTTSERVALSIREDRPAVVSPPPSAAAASPWRADSNANPPDEPSSRRLAALRSHFRALRCSEAWREVWRQGRREALVGGGGDGARGVGHTARNAETTRGADRAVCKNMMEHYSLHAALTAELMAYYQQRTKAMEPVVEREEGGRPPREPFGSAACRRGGRQRSSQPPPRPSPYMAPLFSKATSTAARRPKPLPEWDANSRRSDDPALPLSPSSEVCRRQPHFLCEAMRLLPLVFGEAAARQVWEREKKGSPSPTRTPAVLLYESGPLPHLQAGETTSARREARRLLRCFPPDASLAAWFPCDAAATGQGQRDEATPFSWRQLTPLYGLHAANTRGSGGGA